MTVTSCGEVGVQSARFRQWQTLEICEALKAEAYVGTETESDEVAAATSFRSRPPLRPCPTGGSPAGRAGDVVNAGRVMAWQGMVVVV